MNNKFFQVFKSFSPNIDVECLNEAKRMMKTEWKVTLEMQSIMDASNCIEMGKFYYK